MMPLSKARDRLQLANDKMKAAQGAMKVAEQEVASAREQLHIDMKFRARIRRAVLAKETQ